MGGKQNKRRVISAAVAGVACVFASSTRAQVSGLNKGQLWFLKNGLQLQALSTNFDPWDLSRMQAANYSAVNWLWDSNVTLQGIRP